MSKDDIIAKQAAIIKARDKIIAQRNAHIEQLYKMLKGFKSERYVPDPALVNQPTLFAELVKEVEPLEKEETTTVSYERKKKKHNGRNSFPKHLPVKEVIIEPLEDTTGLVRIGEEVTETLDYTPASIVIIRTIRPKYAKPNNEGVIIGDLPIRPIPKGIAEASLLAFILVKKFLDHLPFYRQIQIFKREYGWDVSKSTLNDWMAACTKLLEPLYNLMLEKILASGYVQADETGLKVLDTNKKGDTHKGWMWLYYAPEQKMVYFNYRKGRGQHGPKEILKGYEGYLQVDGYTVYDIIGKDPNIKLAGCLAHVRRKYFDAKKNFPMEANKVLGLIKKIYLLERKYKEEKLTIAEKTKKRQEEILPIMSEWKNWIDKQILIATPKSDLGKALTYSVNQWHKIETIINNGRIELDNNLIENAVRPLALGRKNYLFAGSHSGAERIAILYSMLHTCKKNDVNPYLWLKDVLNRLPNQSILKLEELLPNNWNNQSKGV